jgi:polyprenyl-phospho-N-acetylgalactosaminyl synthase
VVVDDGSTDGSHEIARKQGAVCLRHFINRGQGAALETGNQYALSNGAEIVVHFDSDGQHQSSDIPALVKPIVEGRADIVLGSRFLNSKDKVPFIKKWLILKPANFFQNHLLGIKLTDAQNGFRALSRSTLGKISITQDGWAHCSEIIEQIKIKKLRYEEVPVTIIYNEFGQNFLTGLKIIFDLLIGKLNK